MLRKQQGQLGMRIRCRLLPTSRRRCRLLGGDTAAFCASLVEGLAHLESTLDQVVDHHHHHHGGAPPASSGTVSMRWCADAMRLLKRMQHDMLAIFRKADVPVSSAAADSGDCSWFEHYMQETAALLDSCNALKAAVSRILRYCMLVDFAAAQQLLCRRAASSSSGGSGGGAAAAAAALLVVDGAGEPCQAQAAFRDKMADAMAVVAEAERLGRAIIVSGDGDGGGMVVITLVAKITTSVLSMFVLQALTTAPPPATAVVVNGGGGVRPPAIASAVSVPELEPWCESLSLIHARFPSPVAVAEHEKVTAAVRDLVVNGGGGGGEGQEEEALRARSGELREGVEMFDCVVDEVFDEVVRGRNEMLGILRDKALI